MPPHPLLTDPSSLVPTDREVPDAVERAFRDGWLRRLNRVLVLPSVLFGGLGVVASQQPIPSAGLLAAFVVVNLALSHVEIADHPSARGGVLRATANALLLGAFAWSVAPCVWGSVLGIATIFGGLFSLRTREALGVQGASIAGIVVGQILGGVPWIDILGATCTLVAVAILGRALYDPLRIAVHRAEEHARLSRAASERARAALETRNHLMAILSHEIRTPMNGVLGMAALLQDTPLTDGQRAMVDTIVGSGGGLRRVLDDLVDLSHLEQGTLAIVKEGYDPTRLLEEVVTLRRMAGIPDAVELSVSVGGLPCQVEGDGARVRQVVAHLLGNAVRFTSEGQIAIEATWSDAHLRIRVCDTGRGIDLEALPRLFEPFELGDDPRGGGAGLGLAITRGLVDAMDGTLDVTSTPDEGSEFTVSLPAPRVEPQPETSPSPRLTGRLLVVDDNPVNLRVACALLEGLGCEVVAVTDGAAALEQDVSTFDAVLMDCQMPGVDGFEATRELRRRGFERPIVAVTAGVSPAERERCRDAGMDDIIDKPLDRCTLGPALARWLPRAESEAASKDA